MLGKNNVTVQKLGLSDDNKIYINESLTKDTNTLFYIARQCKKNLNSLPFTAVVVGGIFIPNYLVMHK